MVGSAASPHHVKGTAQPADWEQKLIEMLPGATISEEYSSNEGEFCTLRPEGIATEGLSSGPEPMGSPTKKDAKHAASEDLWMKLAHVVPRTSEVKTKALLGEALLRVLVLDYIMSTTISSLQPERLQQRTQTILSSVLDRYTELSAQKQLPPGLRGPSGHAITDTRTFQAWVGAEFSKTRDINELAEQILPILGIARPAGNREMDSESMEGNEE